MQSSDSSIRTLFAFPELLKQKKRDRLSGIFVKNLETVQGDERDIIIISVGYGKDEEGRLTQNFGPLNREKGWRRLNVAITRARMRLELVASIRPDDIRASTGSIDYLRKYIVYCSDADKRLAMMTDSSPTEILEHESPFEEDVADLVRSWGYTVEAQVGCSSYRVDLGVVDPTSPGRYILGIECDGAMYHSSKVARDRDRLRQQTLEALGWRLHRIWGLAWYRNRRTQEERLKSALEGAREEVSKSEPEADLVVGPPAETVQDVVPFRPAAKPSWTMPYQVCVPLELVHTAFAIHEKGARLTLLSVLQKVIEAEGPICLDLVAQRTRDAWQLKRTGSRILDVVVEALAELKHNGSIVEVGGFFMSRGEQVYVRVPVDGNPATERPISQVSPLELEKAIEGTIRDSGPMPDQALVRAVAEVFGWERTGTQIEQSLSDLLQELISDGQLGNGDGLVTIPRKDA